MTRKDYQLLADIVKEQMDLYDDDQHEEEMRVILDLTTSLADALFYDNPRFLYQRFYDACNMAAPHD